MKQKEWFLLMKSQPDTTPSFRTLRPFLDGVLQYTTSTGEYLAVHTVEPYGSISEQARQDPRSTHTLPVAERGEDYTIFEVSPETIALEGLTLGTGHRHAELLKPVYHKIGRLLSEIAVGSPKPPLFGVGDVAYDRKSDSLLFVPPLEFAGHAYTVDDYAGYFKRSIVECFSNFWLPQVLSAIQSEINEGSGI